MVVKEIGIQLETNDVLHSLPLCDLFPTLIHLTTFNVTNYCHFFFKSRCGKLEEERTTSLKSSFQTIIWDAGHMHVHGNYMVKAQDYVHYKETNSLEQQHNCAGIYDIAPFLLNVRLFANIFL